MNSNSPAFSFNKIDWIKTARFMLVIVAALVLTYVLPFLSHFSYMVHGFDYSPFVLMVIATIGEGLRRYITNHGGTPTFAPPTAPTQ